MQGVGNLNFKQTKTYQRYNVTSLVLMRIGPLILKK